MKKRHSPEQIVSKLRQADVALGKGLKVPEVCRQLGVSEQTYYRWRTKYGGMDPLMAKQMKELEKENARLKKLLAEAGVGHGDPRRRRPAQTCRPRASASGRGRGASSFGA